MRKLCLLLALALLLGSTAYAFEDTQAHWAQEYIERCVEQELFNGISETRFDPDGIMTRAMFVTVLGRLEGVDAENWSGDERFFADVDPQAYYAPYVAWAVCSGMVNGMTPTTFEPDTPITREQMAKLIAYYIDGMGHTLSAQSQEDVVFADAGTISAWAAESVESLRTSGILKGAPDANGALRFSPQKAGTRAECAAIFCRVAEQLARNPSPPAVPETLTLVQSDISLAAGETYRLLAVTEPSDVTCPLYYHSFQPQVAAVDEDGTVSYVGAGTATVGVYAANGLHAICRVTCGRDLAGADESFEDKCMRLFGQVVAQPKLYYAGSDGVYDAQDYARAAADMVQVTVRTWDLDKNGEKYTRTFTITVHKNLADTVVQIFDEIYQGQERFPIHNIGSFSHGGRSEHTIGCAIDLNWEENYYYNPKTGEQVGDHWLPGEDPYSIPLDGEVARIFAKYGFTQGAYWQSGTVDYMHFSYFGE